MVDKIKDKTTTDSKGKQVVDRLSRKERIEELKIQIREIGFWNMPPQKMLAEKYGVSQTMIYKDLKKIISTFDPKELDEVFTAFYAADKKIARELSIMIYQGSTEEKLRAAQVMLQLQKGFTELLENYEKKRKVPDKMEHKIASVVVNIIKPAEEETYEVGGEKEPEKPKTKKTKGEGNG